MKKICKLDDVPIVEPFDGRSLSSETNVREQAFETEIEIKGEMKPIFIIRFENEVRAYANSCPHVGARLNWQPGIFFDDEKQYIQCGIHGAIFEKDTGLCVFGPCINESLQSVDVKIVDEELYY